MISVFLARGALQHTLFLVFEIVKNINDDDDDEDDNDDDKDVPILMVVNKTPEKHYVFRVSVPSNYYFQYNNRKSIEH